MCVLGKIHGAYFTSSWDRCKTHATCSSKSFDKNMVLPQNEVNEQNPRINKRAPLGEKLIDSLSGFPNLFRTHQVSDWVFIQKDGNFTTFTIYYLEIFLEFQENRLSYISCIGLYCHTSNNLYILEKLCELSFYWRTNWDTHARNAMVIKLIGNKV